MQSAGKQVRARHDWFSFTSNWMKKWRAFFLSQSCSVVGVKTVTFRHSNENHSTLFVFVLLIKAGLIITMPVTNRSNLLSGFLFVCSFARTYVRMFVCLFRPVWQTVGGAGVQRLWTLTTMDSWISLWPAVSVHANMRTCFWRGGF